MLKEHINFDLRQITNMIRDSISPDIRMFKEYKTFITLHEAFTKKDVLLDEPLLMHIGILSHNDKSHNNSFMADKKDIRHNVYSIQITEDHRVKVMTVNKRGACYLN